MTTSALLGSGPTRGQPAPEEGCGGKGSASPGAAARFSAERCLPGGGRSCVGPDTSLPLEAAALPPACRFPAEVGLRCEAEAKSLK